MLNGQIDFFREKRVLYIVPHEDDEVNMGGGMLHWLASNAHSVKVVYATNGDYRVDAAVRMREALASLRILGVAVENVVFLGYSDQATEGKTHLYQTKGWVSRKGFSETYVPEEIVCEYGVTCPETHAFSKENLIEDIRSVLERERPDVIFAVDFDSHADHRALSLCFEAAMGKLLPSLPSYTPIVYKTFAYPTSYKGYKDFYGKYLTETCFNAEPNNFFPLHSPYYEWEKRVRFALPLEARTRRLQDNIKYRALRQYRSQSISSRADRIISSDEIAFQRRTDNLLLRAGNEINVSSGRAEYLNDFLLYDTSDIMNGNKAAPVFDRGAWIPAVEDNCPEITIQLAKPSVLSSISLYQSIISEDRILKVEINFNGTDNRIYEYNRKMPLWEIKVLPEIPIYQLVIRIIERTGKDAGLSEIELLPAIRREVFWKFSLFGDNILYDEHKSQGVKPDGIYSYDGVEGSSQLVCSRPTLVMKHFSFSFNNLKNLFQLKSFRLYYGIRKKIRKLRRDY